MTLLCVATLEYRCTIFLLEGRRWQIVRINSTVEACLVVFDRPSLGANLSFIVASTVGALGLGCGVILGG
jgi:hypothetical protein